jgi:hypothetical protein
MQLSALALVLAIAPVCLAADDGFTPLFNGKDLTGWEIKENRSKSKDPDQWYVKEGGILAAKSGSGWLGTKEQYGDFILKVEWRIPPGGNSGVFLRVPGVKEGVSPSETGFEIQILDDNAPQYKGKLKPYQFSGSVYHFVGPSKSVFKGANEWNAFEITCKGEHISVVYNGEKVTEVDSTAGPDFAKRQKKGFIGLQNHGSPVEFRNIRIKVE